MLGVEGFCFFGWLCICDCDRVLFVELDQLTVGICDEFLRRRLWIMI